jgi:hypothetical protein
MNAISNKPRNSILKYGLRYLGVLSINPFDLLHPENTEELGKNVINHI